MPNHVHLLVKQLKGFPLGEVVKSWKVFTARKANAILGRSGQFWMREYHDRRIRDEEQMNRAVAYIRNNPVKAGLCERPEDWPWSSVSWGRGDSVRVRSRLRLSQPVRPDLEVDVSNRNVAASAECRTGVCELTVEALFEGESVITLTATADGYTDATGEIEVFVTDPFQLALWRELVFDGYDCPRVDSTTRCTRLWGGRAVEDRITSVLPSQPNFHILTTARFTAGTYRFTPSHVETIKDAIRDAVGQTTGERFDGRITTSSTSLRDQDGWVNIIPIGNDWWEDGVGPCGAASVGARNGTIIVNVDRLDDCDLLPVATHEVGHALGFFHVLDLGDYMMSPFLSGIPPVFHDDEQYHARLAWELGRGARYTPDPRRRSLATLTTDAFSPGGPKTLEGLMRALALGEMVQCRAR